MLKIAHIINPVKVDSTSDLYFAQPITFETMRRAKNHAKGLVDIDLYIANYPEDDDSVPRDFIKTRFFEKSILNKISLKKPKKLPYLKDILDRLYNAAPDADYLIYTNVDIALQPNFYTEVTKIIDQGFDAFTINRRIIPGKYTKIEQLPLMYREKGKPHGGADCFIFPRETYKKFNIGSSIIGTNWIGKIFVTNMHTHSSHFNIFKGLYLTFHLGDERIWQKPELIEYAEHNKQEFIKILNDFKSRGILKEDSLVIKQFLNMVDSKKNIHPVALMKKILRKLRKIINPNI